MTLLETVKTLDRNFTYTFNSSQNLLSHFSRWQYKNAEVVSINSQKLIVKGKKINGEMYDVEVTNIKINQ